MAWAEGIGLGRGEEGEVRNRVAIFREQNYSAEYRQDGTDVSSVGFPPVLQKRKTSEFHSKPFLRRKNPRNSVPNHFSEEKNPQNSVFFFSNYFWMRKTSEFCSKPFSEEKKTWNPVPNNFWKPKNFRILFQIIFGREKLWRKKTTL